MMVEEASASVAQAPVHALRVTRTSRAAGTPDSPQSPESATRSHSISAPPNSATAARTRSTAICCASASRTIPPLPTFSRPTSNCGFTSNTNSNPSPAHCTTAGSTNVAEMNDTSIATTLIGTRVIASGQSWSEFRYRALVFSSNRTRGSLRSFISICPYPVSTAMTCAAPFCSRQSVKPSRRRSNIHAHFPRHIDSPILDRSRQLQAPTADVGHGIT